MSALPIVFVDPLPDVPAFLKNIPNWIRWKLEVVNGKPTKVPYRVDGRKAASTRPEDWVDYETAVTGRTINREQGVGFVVDGGVVGFDLDGCRNPETGEITRWAKDVIETLDAYTEITPSQTGVRVWVRGTLPGNDKVFNLDPAVGFGDKVKIEVFTDSRYFTVTGDAIGDTIFNQVGDVEERNLAEVYQLLHDIRAKHPAPKAAPSSSGKSSPTVQIEKLGNLGTSKYDIFMRGTITSREPFVIDLVSLMNASPNRSQGFTIARI
jgi:primase-polymerase (primpol)-like protein